jgi:hypothetical protein
MTRRAFLLRTRAGDGGEGEPCGPRRGLWGSGSLGCGSDGVSDSVLLPPSSSFESERSWSSSALIAVSERNGSHSISEATRSLMSPISVSRSHNDISFDATTADKQTRELEND